VSALTLRLKAPPPQRVDLSPLTPERLRDRTVAGIAGLRLTCGNRRVPVGELFDVSGDDVANIVISDACARLDGIGDALTAGSMTVEGDAGAYLGRDMRGGSLRVTGNAGPWAAARMGGGTLEIAGDAGELLGAALPGDMRGMSGGLVVVHGNAGERTGDRMRRGVIAVAGKVGDYAGSRMIAGTVLALGGCGAYPGFGMKRGTLLSGERPQALLPTFADAGAHDFGFLRLLMRALATYAETARALGELGLRVHKYVGDAAAAGKGEILVWKL
jgi:formylmethanofuran dehydrogenase subunit C